MIVSAPGCAACAMFSRLMNNRQYPATADTTLIRQAAVAEAEARYWEDRFAGLLDSGLLRFAGVPGRDMGLSAGRCTLSAPSESLAFWCGQILAPAAQGGGHLCLDVSGLERGAADHWQPPLQHAVHGTASISFSLGLGIAAMSARELLATGGGMLGAHGKVAVRYPVPTDGLRGNSAGARWAELVQDSHADTRILPVPTSAVRPLTPLHTSEKGQCVMPAGWFDTRPATAWLLAELDARKLRQPLTVRRQLADCLRFADNLIDTLDWPLPALRLDALLNRRVAVRVTHIGDALVTAGLQANSPGMFSRLQRWLQFVRNSFVHESMLLARRRGPFPELCAGELINSLAVRYGVADARRLVRNRILRHRHLLALSPLSIFPQLPCAGRVSDWIGLVPAIACADAISMAGPDVRARLPVHDWERLLRLTAAIAAGSVRAGATG